MRKLFEVEFDNTVRPMCPRITGRSDDVRGTRRRMFRSHGTLVIEEMSSNVRSSNISLAVSCYNIAGRSL